LAAHQNIEKLPNWRLSKGILSGLIPQSTVCAMSVSEKAAL